MTSLNRPQYRLSQSSIASSSDSLNDTENVNFPASKMEVHVRFNGRENRRLLKMNDSMEDDVTSRSDVTKKDMNSEEYKVEIVRRLIENFDLEKTVERYRNMGTVEYKIQPKDFSLDSALHANRVSGQIRDLMGSDVILLLNKNYREELDKRLVKQHEVKLKIEEKKRADRESQRLRRLLADGVITAEEFQREMGYRDHNSCTTTRRQPSSNRTFENHQHKVSTRAAGSANLKYPHRCFSSKSASVHRSPRLVNQSTRMSVKSAPASYKRTRPLSHHVRSRPRSEVKVIGVTQGHAGRRPLLHRASSFVTESQMSRLYGDYGDESDSDSSSSSGKVNFSDKERELNWTPVGKEDKLKATGTSKSARPKNELLDVLYKEESVEGLYKVAERIFHPFQEENESSNLSSSRPSSTYYLSAS